MSEIKQALKGKNRGKSGDADGFSIGQLNDVCDFLPNKLKVLFNKYFQTKYFEKCYKNTVT